MKHFKSTLLAFCLLLTAFLFSTPLAAQSRGGGGDGDLENVPHIEAEVGWGACTINTGVEYPWSYPLSVSGPIWVDYSSDDSAANNTICLWVKINYSESPRECEVIVSNKESGEPLVVVHIVQAGRSY